MLCDPDGAPKGADADQVPHVGVGDEEGPWEAVVSEAGTRAYRGQSSAPPSLCGCVRVCGREARRMAIVFCTGRSAVVRPPAESQIQIMSVTPMSCGGLKTSGH